MSLLLSVIYLWWLLWLRHSIVRCAARCATPGDAADDAALPAVSVIVYAHNEAENLRHMLPYLLNQEYPEYEVIVVNDGMIVEDSNVVAEFRCKYGNLYETFVPDDTRNVSRRKLALMVGIKAAKNDIIVTTNANSKPTSEKWLRAMCRHFTDGVDVVIGQSVYNYRSDHRSNRLFRCFDSVCTRALYTAWAIACKPYRGTSDNLAYRRDVFFANKGFSKSMNLHYGDDDIFVSEIADKHNTRVELSDESFVNTVYEEPARALRERKFRYDFTSRYIRTHAFVAERIMYIAYWIGFVAVAALAVMSGLKIAMLESLEPLDVALLVAIPFALLLLLTLPGIFVNRTISRLLHMPRLFFTVPLFTLIRPIVNLRYRLKGRLYRQQNFTWQRMK